MTQSARWVPAACVLSEARNACTCALALQQGCEITWNIRTCSRRRHDNADMSWEMLGLSPCRRVWLLSAGYVESAGPGRIHQVLH